MQINWKKQIDKVRHMVDDSEPSLFAFCIRDWDITEQAGLRDLAWALARDDSYATANDAKGLLEMLEAHLTKYTPDVAEATSAEPGSGLESVSAVESDTQPRG